MEFELFLSVVSNGTKSNRFPVCSTSRLYTSIVCLQQVFFIFAYPFPNVAAFMGNEDVKMDEWTHQAGQN